MKFRKWDLFLSSIVLFFIVFLGFVKFSLIRLYKPPLISKKNVNQILNIKKFFDSHKDIKQFGIYSDGQLTLDDNYQNLSAKEYDALFSEIFSNDDKKKMIELANNLKTSSIMYAEKYKENYLFLTYYTKFKFTANGLIYVESGIDPNNINDGYISKHKPYLKITEHWYHSDRLIRYRPSDDLIKRNWPKTLIDNSSKVNDEIKNMLIDRSGVIIPQANWR